MSTIQAAAKCHIKDCQEDAAYNCAFCGKQMCWEHRYSVEEGGLPAKACEACVSKP